MRSQVTETAYCSPKQMNKIYYLWTKYVLPLSYSDYESHSLWSHWLLWGSVELAISSSPPGSGFASPWLYPVLYPNWPSYVFSGPLWLMASWWILWLEGREKPGQFAKLGILVTQICASAKWQVTWGHHWRIRPMNGKDYWNDHRMRRSIGERFTEGIIGLGLREYIGIFLAVMTTCSEEEE